ncbi:MAG: ABC transporter ATP-binding protein [Bdellovibrionaceae bacterium]|nr:ABC transporter ATP-binding protein [Pseudobdellovibrionaceae bacterium]
MPSKENTIVVKNLEVAFKTSENYIKAVNDVSFSIPEGKTMGMVGESGSGKSISALSIMGLIPSPPGEITNGEIFFKGENLLKKSEKEMRSIRGNKISMIFQEPMTSLNPVFTVGDQISESVILHQGLNKKEALEYSMDLMDQVGIPNPKQRVGSYPHEMSGGQRQRIMIAMAIASKPELLIADEPTTALDVTIQKQILDLLLNLKEKYNMSMLFITHDLGVIANIADSISVMHRGKIVEQGNTKDIFLNPQQNYTKGLLACRPTLEKTCRRLPTVEDFLNNVNSTQKVEEVQKPLQSKVFNKTLLEVNNLHKYFPLKKNIFGKPSSWVKAVDDISFKVSKNETLGLVGESGCGKTTLGRTILRLTEPTSGEILFYGKNITNLNKKEMRDMRKKIQIIFQDPYASLNPRMTIGSAIMEPMIIHDLGTRNERIKKTESLLERMNLPANVMNRYPHEFSGGQRQRICIARALAVQPEFIVCDESVSALDVSIQAQILNLLLDLQEELKLTYIFISHDLGVIKFISDNIAVMKNGKFVEYNTSEAIYKQPQQKYTQDLLSAIPKTL